MLQASCFEHRSRLETLSQVGPDASATEVRVNVGVALSLQPYVDVHRAFALRRHLKGSLDNVYPLRHEASIKSVRQCPQQVETTQALRIRDEGVD